MIKLSLDPSKACQESQNYRCLWDEPMYMDLLGEFVRQQKLKSALVRDHFV